MSVDEAMLERLLRERDEARARLDTLAQQILTGHVREARTSALYHVENDWSGPSACYAASRPTRYNMAWGVAYSEVPPQLDENGSREHLLRRLLTCWVHGFLAADEYLVPSSGTFVPGVWVPSMFKADPNLIARPLPRPQPIVRDGLNLSFMQAPEELLLAYGEVCDAHLRLGDRERLVRSVTRLVGLAQPYAWPDAQLET